VSDLGEHLGLDAVEVGDLGVARVVGLDADELGVGPGVVGHPEDAHRASRDPAPGEGRLLEQHEGVERVAVLSQRVGHEAVVRRVDRGREEAAVEAHHALLVVVLVLVAAAAGDLHDDVERVVHAPHVGPGGPRGPPVGSADRGSAGRDRRWSRPGRDRTDARMPGVIIQKLTSTEGFVAFDLDDAPAVGVVRSRPKILV
jgi:hypothetical protein